jgi:hypothetical protein
MLVDFNTLPETSRVWIYQAGRSFSSDEISELRAMLDEFITQWTAHGSDLEAGYDLPYNRFIVLALDQSLTSASGCSRDASLRFIQSEEQRSDMQLLDKMNVS